MESPFLPWGRTPTPHPPLTEAVLDEEIEGVPVTGYAELGLWVVELLEAFNGDSVEVPCTCQRTVVVKPWALLCFLELCSSHNIKPVTLIRGVLRKDGRVP